MRVLPWHQEEFSRLAAARERPPHALLISGRAGTGKLLFAQALAQALLCESPDDAGMPCERCASCGWMRWFGHPDFRLLEPAGATVGDEEMPAGERKKPSPHITIEQVREITDFINISSHRNGYRIILIHPAEAMNPNAANALLKGLEEAPAGVCFVLVTHRVRYLLPTVRSRCRLLALPAPAPDQAERWLSEQGVKDSALALAHTGHAPLLAQRLAREDYWEQRKLLLGQVADLTIDPLQLAERIKDFAVADVVEWLQKWTFDLALCGYAGSVRYNPDYEAEISALAKQIDLLGMLRFHRETLRLQRVIGHPLNARLLFEQLLIDYAALVRTNAPR
jgi:DNA polymerase-3 subunit delta'